MLRSGIFILVIAAAVSQAGLLDGALDKVKFFTDKGFNLGQLTGPKDENELGKKLDLVKGLLSYVTTSSSLLKTNADDETKKVIDNAPKMKDDVNNYEEKVYKDTKKPWGEKLSEWANTVRKVFEDDKLKLVVQLLQTKMPGKNAAAAESSSVAILLIPAVVLTLLR